MCTVALIRLSGLQRPAGDNCGLTDCCGRKWLDEVWPAYRTHSHWLFELTGSSAPTDPLAFAILDVEWNERPGTGGAIRFSMESWTRCHRLQQWIYLDSYTASPGEFARAILLLAGAPPNQNWACVPTSVQPWAAQVQVCKKRAANCSKKGGEV